MARIVLFLMLFAAIVLVAAAVMTLARTLAAPPVPREAGMPRVARTLAFVLLLLLLLGLASGFMGPG